MRGTIAVILTVLLVVLVAHMQREEAQRNTVDADPASMAYQSPDRCETTPSDAEVDLDSQPAAVATVGDSPDAH